jgi:RNA polymerase sigma-70 factor (ECF subfamily)
MNSDQLLVKRTLRGDTYAFDELVKTYQNKVYMLAYRYMGNEDDANDMAQESFIKAFRSLRSFKGDASFGTWIYRITTNVCLDELRRRNARSYRFLWMNPWLRWTGMNLSGKLPTPPWRLMWSMNARNLRKICSCFWMR